MQINPVTVIELEYRSPYPIKPPHILLTASDLPVQQQLCTPVYLILPSKPYTALSSLTVRHLLHLTDALPKKHVTILFPLPISTQQRLSYETLFSAPSLTGHPARNLLASLPLTTINITPLSLTLPSNTVLSNLLLTQPSTPPNKSLLPQKATLVALGASPPPSHTLHAIPGYNLFHIPAPRSSTSTFLTHLHTNKSTLLLRFPDNNHLFLHSIHDLWHGLLLPPLPTTTIPLLNPILIARHLKHPPRTPIHRPLIRLPIYHKPPTTPQTFSAAIEIVARRIPGINRDEPPTIASLTALDSKLLSNAIKQAALHESSTHLKRARFHRLHARVGQKRPKESVIAPSQKRQKTRYFATALSSALSTHSSHQPFYNHNHPSLRWVQLGQRFGADFARAVHGTDACDEVRDSCLQACENLIGKSVVEFSAGKVGKLGAQKIRSAVARLRSGVIRKKVKRSEQEREDAFKKIVDLARGGSLSKQMKTELLTALSSQVEA